MKETNYYVIKKKAVPEVLLKVLEVQKTVRFKESSFCIRSHREGWNQQKLLLQVQG